MWKYVDGTLADLRDVVLQLRKYSLWKFQQHYQLPGEAAEEHAHLVGFQNYSTFSFSIYA